MPKLRVGLVGCGNIAINAHIPAYLGEPDRFELVALADPTEAQLALGLAAAGLGDDHGYADPFAMIARADIDLIDICAPQHLHRGLIEAAASAGHDIVCEKPLAAVPADAAAAVDAAQAAGVHLSLIHNYLFFPEVVAAKRILDTGELGTVRVVTVNFLGVVDSTGADGFRPKWRHDYASSGGGVLMDMLHGLYLAEHLLGTPVERVSALVTSHSEDDPVESLALCRLESGDAAAMVNVGWGVGHGGIEVVGSLGRLTIRYEDGGTCPWASFESLTVTTSAGTRDEPVVFEPESEMIGDKVRWSMKSALCDFAEAIDDGRPPTADGTTGLRILETTMASYASGATGRTVALPLDPSDPLHRRGVAGIEELEVASSSPVRTHQLFGIRRNSD